MTKQESVKNFNAMKSDVYNEFTETKKKKERNENRKTLSLVVNDDNMKTFLLVVFHYTTWTQN